MDIYLRDITFGYNADRKIFENFSAHFESKKTHVVLGKSGSGKSTLLKLLAGELLPEHGTIESKGWVWKQLEESPIPGFKHVAFLNQEFDLLPYSTVKENIRRRLHGYSPQEEEDIIRDVALKLDISEILERRAVDVSGGQKQRVAFAAALAKRPQVLLMDEPLSNQDFKNAENIKDIIQWLRGHKTLIIATHEGSEALQLADFISVLHDGKIVQKGIPRKVYESPANQYVAGLLGHYNLVPRQWLAKNLGFRIGAEDSENVLLRPHKLILSRTHGIPCRVIRAEYFGMYYLVLIEADGYLLYVYYPHNHFEPNERWKIALHSH
ncbi:MAG: ATP-binding cassette domain-containing protein [Thermaurantimonas sp.]|uniref:ATP-binding cassette domain-containing protein n=1 Tax=Thermaurantimonas sp. TaxID=2681568 RepID=UPI00391A86D1